MGASNSSRLKFGKYELRWPALRDRDDYQREMFAIAGLLIVCFLWLSMIGFYPYDSSPIAVSSPAKAPRNWLGPAGAYLAGSLIYAFGSLSFLIPLPVLNLSLLALRASKKTYSLSRSLGWLLLLASIAMIVAELWPKFHYYNIDFASAGWLGETLTRSIRSVFGPVGLGLISTALALQGLLLISRRPIIMPILLTLAKTPRPKLNVSVRSWSWRSAKKKKKVDEEPFEDIDTPHKHPDRAPRMDEPVIGIQDHLSPQDMPANQLASLACTEPGISTRPIPKLDIMDHSTAIAESHPELPTNGLSPETEASTTSSNKSSKPYQPPEINLFRSSPNGMQATIEQKKEFQQTADQLIKTLADFGIEGEVVAIQPGPVVAVYEFQPKAGTKLSKLTGLIDDIALALKVDSIFIHPVSGKRAVGIQVPNRKRETVFLGDILQSDAFQKASSPLTFAMGKSLSGEPVCEDLAAMPHLLTAGQTGSGKSVAINTLLCSIILKASPKDVRMILVDPKILELKIYEGIPHLLMPVITEAPKASLALKWACYEMDRRYQLMELAKVRHISGFNQYWEQANEAERERLRRQADCDQEESLPYIVIVIDELADLMLTAPKDVEASIQRLAQKARASGIHLVLATQRPSVDVITGVIKANLPCRSSFKVFSRGDSRTILDCIGAERLLGKGDMLFLKPGSSRLQRMQGAFLDDEEVVRMVEAVRASGQTANYDEQAISWIEDAYQKASSEKAGGDLGLEEELDDPKWDEALSIAQSQGQVSASYLQRSLKIGYNRAARMVESMERQGLVSGADGSKARKWIGPAAI